MANSPLQKLHIINTRPKYQATTWSKQLKALGATVSDVPAIEIVATKQNWMSMILPIHQFDHIIFISSNAVDYFMPALPKLNIELKQSQISTIGKQTAMRLADHSIKSHFPSVANSEHLLAMPHLHNVNRQNILVVKGVGGRRLLANTLRRRGAIVKQINVYRRICPKPPINIDNLWQDRKEKIILVTSKVAIDHLFQMMNNYHLSLQQATWLVLSQRIATYARRKGVEKIIIFNGERLTDILVQHQQGLAHD